MLVLELEVFLYLEGSLYNEHVQMSINLINLL